MRATGLHATISHVETYNFFKIDRVSGSLFLHHRGVLGWVVNPKINYLSSCVFVPSGSAMLVLGNTKHENTQWVVLTPDSSEHDYFGVAYRYSNL